MSIDREFQIAQEPMDVYNQLKMLESQSSQISRRHLSVITVHLKTFRCLFILGVFQNSKTKQRNLNVVLVTQNWEFHQRLISAKTLAGKRF